jgi:Na+-transporting NADH:ubiquinone oxidoreductase subunit B
MSGNNVWVNTGSGPLTGQNASAVDGHTGETFLAQAANAEEKVQFVNQAGDQYKSLEAGFMDAVIGTIPGSVGETSVIAIAIGAFILLWSGIGSWRIMLSTLLGGIAMAGIFNAAAINPFMELPIPMQLAMGGFAFGLVFMATDPVTAAQTNKGKWIYGFLIGFLAIMIRVFNPAYPEGMMLAILFMNVMAPLIDHYVVEANAKHRIKRAEALSSSVQQEEGTGTQQETANA